MDKFLSYSDENYVKPVKLKLSVEEAVGHLRNGWLGLFGSYPDKKALAILSAHSCLESGWWENIMNCNFGNLKMISGHKFTMFATGENIYNKKLGKTEWHWFEPPHYQTGFRSYENMDDGAKDYIKFLSDRNSGVKDRDEKYRIAFEYLKSGMPLEYGLALYKAGYYTANPDTYTKSLIKLYNQFLKIIEEKYPDVQEITLPMDTIVVQGVQESVVAKPAPGSVRYNETPLPPVQASQYNDKAPNTQAFLIAIAAIATTIYAWLSGLF